MQIEKLRIEYDDGGMEVFHFNPLSLAKQARSEQMRPSEILGITQPSIALDFDARIAAELGFHDAALYGKTAESRME